MFFEHNHRNPYEFIWCSRLNRFSSYRITTSITTLITTSSSMLARLVWPWTYIWMKKTRDVVVLSLDVAGGLKPAGDQVPAIPTAPL